MTTRPRLDAPDRPRRRAPGRAGTAGTAGTVADRPTSDLDVQVGMDLLAVADVQESIDRLGERYLARLFTPGERAYCEQAPSQAAARYAARMAAKEAVRKVLRPDTGLEFRDAEVVRDPDGAPRLRLHGRTRELATARGFVSWSVSLTHDAGIAGAVVVGTRIDRQPRGTQGDPEGDRQPD